MALEKRSPSLIEKLVPVLMIASIGLAFAVGVLWTKVQGLESGGAVKTAGTTTTGTTGTGNTNTQPAVANPDALPTTVTKLSENLAKKLPAVSSSDYLRGNKNAEITLIEYSDLECPFCKQFHATAKQVMTDYNGKVAWVWRHYPIAQLHSKAPKEAEATECAQELGGVDAFWKLVDKIYEVTPANNGLTLAELPTYASQVGLNQEKFKTCLDSGKYADKIEKAVNAATTLGASGTPANFIVNKKGEVWIIPGALPLTNVKAVIDEALQS
jgi:protein-disulfide isomerase